MNIYLIQEDGQALCWQAESMQQAVQLAEDRHIMEATKEELEPWDYTADKEAEERENYRANILQSCQLVGELANA
jgi:hypothetical protein